VPPTSTTTTVPPSKPLDAITREANKATNTNASSGFSSPSNAFPPPKTPTAFTPPATKSTPRSTQGSEVKETSRSDTNWNGPGGNYSPVAGSNGEGTRNVEDKPVEVTEDGSAVRGAFPKAATAAGFVASGLALAYAVIQGIPEAKMPNSANFNVRSFNIPMLEQNLVPSSSKDETPAVTSDDSTEAQLEIPKAAVETPPKDTEDKVAPEIKSSDVNSGELVGTPEPRSSLDAIDKSDSKEAPTQDTTATNDALDKSEQVQMPAQVSKDTEGMAGEKEEGNVDDAKKIAENAEERSKAATNELLATDAARQLTEKWQAAEREAKEQMNQLALEARKVEDVTSSVKQLEADRLVFEQKQAQLRAEKELAEIKKLSEDPKKVEDVSSSIKRLEEERLALEAKQAEQGRTTQEGTDSALRVQQEASQVKKEVLREEAEVTQAEKEQLALKAKELDEKETAARVEREQLVAIEKARLAEEQARAAEIKAQEEAIRYEKERLAQEESRIKELKAQEAIAQADREEAARGRAREAELKAQEGARIKAEQEAAARAGKERQAEEARIKSEGEARVKAEQEAAAAAERERLAQETRAKAQQKARVKAEQEKAARVERERLAQEEARIKAAQEKAEMAAAVQAEKDKLAKELAAAKEEEAKAAVVAAQKLEEERLAKESLAKAEATSIQKAEEEKISREAASKAAADRKAAEKASQGEHTILYL